MQIKSKKVISWSSWKKNESIFCNVYILSEDIFFNICVLSQCIVHWIDFQSIYTFTYQKAWLHTLFCLFLKLSKAFIVFLRGVIFIESSSADFVVFWQIYESLSPGNLSFSSIRKIKSREVFVEDFLARFRF